MQHRRLAIALLVAACLPPAPSNASGVATSSPALAAGPGVAGLALPDWASFLPAAEVTPPALPADLLAQGGPAAAGWIAAQIVAPPTSHLVSGTIVSGLSFATALRRAGVGAGTVDLLVRELSSIFDFRRARPGDRYTLLRGSDGGIVEFAYESVSHEKYRVFRQGAALVAEKKGGDIVRRTARLAGVVTSTLYDTIQELGEAPALAHDFADIFAYDVDFARGLQRGDEFQILYDRLYRMDANGGERYLRPGRIHAAHFSGANGEHTAIYYETDGGHGGYYRPDGSPVRRSFLVAPLKYTRVSSAFTSARFHPILKYTRPHPGIDYAAPYGTPLWAVGDGKVVQMGWTSGYGQMITIEHASGYASYYAHLSRFAKGLRVGDTVRQKQMIGYVGSSGLATGPHVCFRMTKDGSYVNPASLRLRGLALESVARDREFRAARETLLAGLRSSELVAIDEAL